MSWMQRLYHAVTCMDTVCDPSCDIADPAQSGGRLRPRVAAGIRASERTGPMSQEANQQVGARSLCAGRPVLSRLRHHHLADDVTWVLPPDLLPGRDELDGVPIVHADVPGPPLAHWVRRQGDA